MSTETIRLQGRIGGWVGRPPSRESRQGRQTAWSKFSVRGIDWVTDKQIRDGPHTFRVGSADVPVGRVFTVWVDGSAVTSHFGICQAGPLTAPVAHWAAQDRCWISGRFRALASAESDTLARRLLSWWIDALQARYGQDATEHDRLAEFDPYWLAAIAQELGTQIQVRGRKYPIWPEELRPGIQPGITRTRAQLWEI